MWKVSFVLCLFLAGCAAIMDSQAGRTKGAVCLATHDTVVTSWGREACVIRGGQRFVVTGPGDTDWNTRNVSTLDHNCFGNMNIGAMEGCRGGITLAETIFPFMQPLPH